jgi:uncharacterized membrane protein
MDSWVILGLISALCFGINIIIFKLGFKGGFNPYLAELIFVAGVFVVTFIAFVLSRSQFSVPMPNSVFLFVAGIAWGLGGIAISVALSLNADASKLAVLAASNVVVSVLLGIFLLGEAASAAAFARIGVGMLLVVGGVVVLSLK